MEKKLRISDSTDSLKERVNAVKIYLDGRVNASLDWKEAKKIAQQSINRGLSLFWELDLGLFSSLSTSISDQTQFLALGLSLEHFRDTIWKEFQETTIGVCLYRGSADFHRSFEWDEKQVMNLRGWLEDRFKNAENLSDEIHLEVSDFRAIYPYLLEKSFEGMQQLSLFCRDACVEYIALLANRLPDTISGYMLLDIADIADPLFQAQLLSKDRYESLNLAIKGSLLPSEELRWEEGIIFNGSAETPTLGICFPPMEMARPSQFKGLREALKRLIREKIPFRLIPESHLISEWDGLDELIYVPSGLSPQGKRKLQGFCAAGGTVITLGEKLGLAHEKSYEYKP